MITKKILELLQKNLKRIFSFALLNFVLPVPLNARLRFSGADALNGGGQLLEHIFFGFAVRPVHGDSSFFSCSIPFPSVLAFIL